MSLLVKILNLTRKLEELLLINSSLSDDDIKEIVGAFGSCSSCIKNIDLEANANITGKGEAYLADFLETNISLRRLNLSGCSKLGLSGVCSILESLKSHPDFRSCTEELESL
jgi:hypothetical protein